ncbi:DUF1707 domain-containing protein [Streptacidiphilus sp. EB129]|uniref:DUF1707 SHOCT-like domain-containing protein n=1 Tax=Streptacidiphilus sp. EB129 TaxID=3156262 RepID=UPI00351745DC
MSNDLAPALIRASHEDRDRTVEALRVAAGDGRLDAEELDQRLESALTARTCGELDLLVRDLPAPGPSAAGPDKDLARLRAHRSSIERTGPWSVPRRLELEARSGTAVLDFTEAVLGGPALDLALDLRSSTLTVIVPPGVAVAVDEVAVNAGVVTQRVRRGADAPVALLVTLSGTVTSSVVTVRRPRRHLFRWRRARG